MRKINVLTEDTIVKIAAGEIIENPASIIKELVENSIDANSTNINIEIFNNGKDKIIITDNGHGFSKEDLKIAFKRHTTSKLSDIEDIKDTYTLGFRGEALSSIAYVSNITIITKRAEDPIGYKAIIDHDGNIISLDEIVCQDGTTIICENLFDSIPVRDIYLKARNYEINLTNNMITNLVISRPDISIAYYKDERLIMKTDPNDSPKNNIYSVLGSELSENLIEINIKDEEFKLSGYISNNILFRSSRNNQYLFVNGRGIKEDEITKSIESAYRSMIPINRYPAFILYLDIDNKYIDINIHPKKNIINFINIDHISEVIYDNVSNVLSKELLIPEISKKEENKNNNIFAEFLNESNERVENTILESHEPAIEYKDLSTSLERDMEHDEKRISIDSFSPEEVKEENFIEENSNTKSKTSELDLLLPHGYRYIGYFLNQYILLEDSKENAMYFLDQHGAHERINYEKFKSDFESKNIISQKLIDGYLISLSTPDYDYIMSIKDKLYNLGIEIDDFGDNYITVRSIPIYLDNLNPEQLINDLLDREDRATLYDFDPYRVMKLACSASIKSGDYITPKDVTILIEELKATDMPLTCPHGRPTIIKMTKEELDKEFFRIQNG